MWFILGKLLINSTILYVPPDTHHLLLLSFGHCTRQFVSNVLQFNMEIMILANEVNLHRHTIGSGMSEQTTGILIFLCFMTTLTLAVLTSRHRHNAL